MYECVCVKSAHFTLITSFSQLGSDPAVCESFDVACEGVGRQWRFLFYIRDRGEQREMKQFYTWKKNPAISLSVGRWIKVSVFYLWLCKQNIKCGCNWGQLEMFAEVFKSNPLIWLNNHRWHSFYIWWSFLGLPSRKGAHITTVWTGMESAFAWNIFKEMWKQNINCLFSYAVGFPLMSCSHGEQNNYLCSTQVQMLLYCRAV